MKKMSYICIWIGIDAISVIISAFLALLVRFDGNVIAPYWQLTVQHLPVLIGSAVLSLFLFRLYHRLWRYASIGELVSICLAVSLFTVAVFTYDAGVAPRLLPLSVYILYCFFSIALIGASRFLLRIFLRFRRKQVNRYSRVLIVGAGDAGAMIARELKNNYYNQKQLVGFVDDDPYKQHQNLFGANVLGSRKEIAAVVCRYQVDEILIAMPSVGGSVIKEILEACKSLDCAVKTLPGMYEMIDGDVTVQQFRKVAVEDLLRRDPVKLDMQLLTRYLKGKRVLITGAGGSIGSELCRQVLKVAPAELYLLGRGENSIYEIENDLRFLGTGATKLVAVIADVRDKERLKSVFAEFQPEVVFHAAAHKHVPLMEAQPAEAIRNNIFGTKNVAEAAHLARVERFVMISTDKAVNPTSVMGATKRVAEMIIQNMNRSSKTKFITVRFGNVLGSRGSVLPLFKKQIARGGPITITDMEMRRYFMTIPEASQLVLQAGSMAEGGEVFVLDMGKPVKIYDMACDLINLSGLKVGEDIKIEATGLRPGEKLFEELLTPEEGTCATKHDQVYSANLRHVDETKLHSALAQLRHVDDSRQIIELLAALIPGYKSEKLRPPKAQDTKTVGMQ